jgi:glutamine amidotransferase
MIAILNYDGGNITSVKNALNRLGYTCVLTDNKEEILAADKIIIPGVGHMSSAISYFKKKGIDVIIPELKQPVLGICLGMQLLCRYSEEGGIQGLSVFDCIVKKFPTKNIIPHMGWNNLYALNTKLFQGFSLSEDVYFVHSYYVELCKDTAASCDYILPFSAALQKDNFWGVQFHPEKSGSSGEKILLNFLSL